MLVKPSIDELLPKTHNRYTLAVLVAKRTRQLVSGAQPLIDSEQENLVSLASEEVEASAVVGVDGEVKPEIPLRPEVLEAREQARLQDENQLALDAIRTNFGLDEEELRNRPQPTFLTLLDDQLTREAEEAERERLEAEAKAERERLAAAEEEEEEEEADEDDDVLEGDPGSEEESVDEEDLVTDEDVPEHDEYDEESDAEVDE